MFGGAVERLDGQCEQAVWVEQHRLLQLFGRVQRDRGAAHGVEEEVVGKDVELRLGIAAASTPRGTPPNARASIP